MAMTVIEGDKRDGTSIPMPVKVKKTKTAKPKKK